MYQLVILISTLVIHILSQVINMYSLVIHIYVITLLFVPTHVRKCDTSHQYVFTSDTHFHTSDSNFYNDSNLVTSDSYFLTSDSYSITSYQYQDVLTSDSHLRHYLVIRISSCPKMWLASRFARTSFAPLEISTNVSSGMAVRSIVENCIKSAELESNLRVHDFCSAAANVPH